MTRATTEAVPAATSGPRTSRLVMFGLVLALVVAIGYVIYAVNLASTSHATSASVVAAAGSALVGHQIPTFSLPVLANDPSARSLGPSVFDGKPLIINVFASWCVPCKVETPMFARLARSVGTKIAFLGVDENDQRAAALAFLSRSGVEYPVVSDNGSLQGKLLLVGIPDTFFVAPSGRVVGVVQGEISASTLSLWIHRLEGATSS